MIKKVILFTVAGLFFVLTINFFLSRMLESHLDKPVSVKNRDASKPNNEEPVKVKSQKRKLVPVDPKKYGFEVRSKENAPRTQLEWDIQVEKITEKSGLLKNKKIKDAIKESPSTIEQYQKNVDAFDERIKYYEELKHSNPSDQQAEEMLQNLYRLKSVSKVLEKDISSSVTAP
ncbi:MAG: hypothetical protein WC676_06745 [Candidatus Omnitrophota bacterium]